MIRLGMAMLAIMVTSLPAVAAPDASAIRPLSVPRVKYTVRRLANGAVMYALRDPAAAADLLRGRANQTATARIVARVTALTGLDPALVRRMSGRVDTATFLREVHRNDGMIGSVYDSNVTAFDPFPWSPRQQTNDTILDALIAPTTSAMVDFVTREAGWKTDARYNALSYAVNKAWDRGRPKDTPVSDLRKAIANDPRMAVMIAHGWDDPSCPFFASRLIVDQLPSFGQAERVKLNVYPGGHMFYSRTDSGAAFKRDAKVAFRIQ